MYSVIIQNQKTLDEFSRYKPLFMEAINRNKVGVCKWIESGDTIDTALPGLPDMTNDKEEWRAVIVRYIDDGPMSEFKFDNRNPFDFTINEDCKHENGESKIPLIKLVNMLGGVPKPEIKFEQKILEEENKTPRIIYESVKDEAAELRYEALCEKYKYDGKLPSSIVLISIREDYDREKLNQEWGVWKESKSSKFWKTNCYSSNSRFLVYDFDKKGPVKRIEDEFGFWTSVMMIATNEIDSSTLQGYRLYELKVVLDKGLMLESFQNSIARLKSARESLKTDIRYGVNSKILEDGYIPDFNFDIGDELREVNQKISVHDFSLLSRGNVSDFSNWKIQERNINDELESYIRKSNRNVDFQIEKIRDRLSFDEDSVYPLNKYQIEDILRKSDITFEKIVHMQGELPSKDMINNSRMKKMSDAIFSNLRGRIEKKSAFLTVFVIAVLIGASTLPEIILKMKTGGLNFVSLTGVTIAEIVSVLIFGLIAILIQKSKLKNLLNEYEINAQHIVNKVSQSKENYRRYLNWIISYSRAHSYLRISERKHNRDVIIHHARKHNIKLMDQLILNIHQWSRAYRLDVDFDYVYFEDYKIEDITLSPEKNPVYTFEYGNSYPVELNKIGEIITSPFSFVRRLEIIREEIYDE